jgi:hypothetical protein
MTDGEKADELSRKLREQGYELRIYPMQKETTTMATTITTTTNEYQPLDPKEWLADPEGWVVEYRMREIGTWVPIGKTFVSLKCDGTLASPDSWRMRRKTKPVVKFICFDDHGRAHLYDMKQTRTISGDPMPNQYVVTFGPDDKSSSCRRVK